MKWGRGNFGGSNFGMRMARSRYCQRYSLRGSSDAASRYIPVYRICIYVIYVVMTPVYMSPVYVGLTGVDRLQLALGPSRLRRTESSPAAL